MFILVDTGKFQRMSFAKRKTNSRWWYGKIEAKKFMSVTIDVAPYILLISKIWNVSNEFILFGKRLGGRWDSTFFLIW